MLMVIGTLTAFNYRPPLGIISPWEDPIANLKIVAEYRLRFKQHSAGSKKLEDFGGGAVHKLLLYLSDMGNQCVQRVILP